MMMMMMMMMIIIIIIISASSISQDCQQCWRFHRGFTVEGWLENCLSWAQFQSWGLEVNLSEGILLLPAKTSLESLVVSSRSLSVTSILLAFNTGKCYSNWNEGGNRSSMQRRGQKEKVGFPITFFETCEARCNGGRDIWGQFHIRVWAPGQVTCHLWDAFLPAHPPVTASFRRWRQDALPRASSGPDTSCGRESSRESGCVKTWNDWLLSVRKVLYGPVSTHTSLWTPSELNFWDAPFPASHLEQTQSPHFTLPLTSPLLLTSYQNEAGEWLISVDGKTAFRDKREPLVYMALFRQTSVMNWMEPDGGTL